MKTKTKMPAKASRVRYSAEFKQQALARAAQDDVAVAAKDLGLQESQLYAWRTRLGWKWPNERGAAPATV